MATLNNFALGRGTGALGITPQTPNTTTGVLTAGTRKTLLGQFKTWKMSQSSNTEDVSPTSARNRNMMILDSGTKIMITGILFAADFSGATNPVTPMVQTNDYVSIDATRGGLNVSVYGIVTDYEEEIKDKGSVTFSLTLGEIDVNTTNPVFT